MLTRRRHARLLDGAHEIAHQRHIDTCPDERNRDVRHLQIHQHQIWTQTAHQLDNPIHPELSEREGHPSVDVRPARQHRCVVGDRAGLLRDREKTALEAALRRGLNHCFVPDKHQLVPDLLELRGEPHRRDESAQVLGRDKNNSGHEADATA